MMPSPVDDLYNYQLHWLLYDCRIARQNLGFWMKLHRRHPIGRMADRDAFYIKRWRRVWQEAYSALARFPAISDWKQ